MKTWFLKVLPLTAAAAVFLTGAAKPEESSCQALRKQAAKLHNDGNYKDAFDVYEKLALDPRNDPGSVGDDLDMAVSCLQQINREQETDALREKFIEVHSENWRALEAAAQSYFAANHYGTVVAGQFERGPHRGGGRYVNSFERDRCRALQLMNMAHAKTGAESDKGSIAGLYLEFAGMLIGYRGYSDAWRLQYLTDLSVLPDYEDGYRYGDGGTSGAPVDPEGNPVFHRIPRSFEEAASDGERWRWLLVQAMELGGPGTAELVLMQFAGFLQEQFGVHTLRRYGWFGPREDEEADDVTGKTYVLHTLREDETIARLATGIKRFGLPDEFNFIKIYLRVAESEQGGQGENALNALAQIFENRRQYDRAVEFWKRSIEKHGDGGWKRLRRDQIVGNWGRFEPVMTHPAGEAATVEFTFRNGTELALQAREIKVKLLLEDMKEYLKSNPRELDWTKMDLGAIGYRLVRQNETKYLGDTVAEWKLPLKPAKMRFNRRITVKTPLKKAGAYLLTAKMGGGNTSAIVMWIDDTAIVKKPLDKGRTFLFAADAVTGEPLPKLNVEFFGYRQESANFKLFGRHYNVVTDNFAEFTGADGQIVLDRKRLNENFNWLIIATGGAGRLAYLGFTGIWHGDYYDTEYNETKVFAITDRPVYRPNQPVKFKIWVRHAKYDQEDTSSFANSGFTVRIHDAKGEKVLDKGFQADAYGGIEGEYMLPGEPALGVYSIQVAGYGGGSFRVEEYKKPEFEVKVEAPSEPVMLGEKITAEVTAKYYFGGAVAKGKIKYKVLRSDYSADWYPYGLWDWFYGRGYWWFAYDYKWYPGWAEWGCMRPYCWWWPRRSAPPEVVAEAEAQIAADGKLKIDIDTSLAKELHGDTDHKYDITVEVTDESRRTIVGQGSVLVARKPFKVYAWVDRGHYRVGDAVRADFSAQTLDNKPVRGKGSLTLFNVSYEKDVPVEKPVEKWDLDTGEEGNSSIQIKAAKGGQYRLSYSVTDAKGHTIEGGYVFCVMGEGSDGKDYRFNEIELVPEKKEYAPGEKVSLAVNTDRRGGTVVLFVRPANGICLEPKIIRLKGKSAVETIEVTKKDMPNFFVEAFTVSGGKCWEETREIIVPPESRVVNVEVVPSAREYKPGEDAKVKVKLSDMDGKPFVGSAVVSVYDRAVEYISGGSNVPEIKAFFWKWRRHHNPVKECTLEKFFPNLLSADQSGMQSIGAFGDMAVEGAGGEDDSNGGLGFGGGAMLGHRGAGRMTAKMAVRERRDFAEPMAAASAPAMDFAVGQMGEAEAKEESAGPGPGGDGAAAEPAVRSNFADTAFWVASLLTDSNGLAEVEFKMPENLTGWKIKTWAMGHGTKVGEGAAEVVTAKKLMVRLQAPRFFVEKDEVTLSANVHNYLEKAKKVRAVLELDGGCLDLPGDKPGTTARTAAVAVEIPANGEQRIDWRVKVVKEGEAVVRMKALTDEESDAMEMKFPVYVHGMLKTESFCGVIRPQGEKAAVEISVPAERRMDESRLEIRYSPTLAGAMVDALPYLVEYPYGCTEQTLNKFLPTVIVQKILKDMGLDLKTIRDKQTNLNAQEIGDDKKRMEDWKRLAGTHRWDGETWAPRNPVFDEEVVADMVKSGVRRLTAMQLSDGGWGWFSGWGEESYPHTTAYVAHGLQIAQANGVALVPGVLDRGVAWLNRYQDEQVRLMKLWDRTKREGKSSADHLDAFVFMVLTDAGRENADMLDHLYRDRNNLAVYAKAMYGIALRKLGDKQKEKLEMIMRNIEQFLVRDGENQTAYLNLGNDGYWWYWYGSEYEAHAYYLKLLAATDPKSDKAAGLVKYLLNNRRHATYWNSTRDTAICIEAMADYLRASGEDKPDMTLEIRVDGRKVKEAKITAGNLFTFDNKLVMIGDAVETGKHTVEIVRQGRGPVYFNAYLSNFTLEDFIARAGLEIKVQRKYYKLNRVDKTVKVAGVRGQALDQKVEKYEREELANAAVLKSGDLVEIELEIESKNDYEYIVFEDMKAAGFEPVEVRSGYTGNDMGAYVEFRDERVCLFVRSLARGRHSVAYRVRAEIPGRFSALPTRAHAMYAPELRANSDEIKLGIED